MKPESTDQDAALLARAKTALDASADALDYRSQLRLQRARQQALAAVVETDAVAPAKTWRRQWLWLAAAPAALVLVLVIALPLRQSPTPALAPSPGPMVAQLGNGDDSWQALADLEVLADEPELDDLADIEFYQWLGDQEASDAV